MWTSVAALSMARYNLAPIYIVMRRKAPTLSHGLFLQRFDLLDYMPWRRCSFSFAALACLTSSRRFLGLHCEKRPSSITASDIVYRRSFVSGPGCCTSFSKKALQMFLLSLQNINVLLRVRLPFVSSPGELLL